MTTWTKRLSGLMAILFVASLLVVLAPAGPAAAATTTAAKPETKTVQSSLRVEYKTKETPIGDSTSYYCAVGTFVSFNDIAGWTLDKVTVDYFDTPWSTKIGAAPYNDEASINGLSFPPVGGRHQIQLGDFSYSQGGSPTVVTETCPQLQATLESYYSSTATITYTREDVSQKCGKAQAKFEKAVAKVRTIQRKVTKLNKQIKQLDKDIQAAKDAGKMGKARSLAKQLDSKKQSRSHQKDKLRDAKMDRAKAGSAAAKACRD